MGAHRARVGGAVAAQFERCRERPVERFDRQPSGHHVHRTGGGRISEKQRGGTAHDLDTLRDHRIERHGMVFRERCGVEYISAVLEHLHTQATLAADDGPARDRAEVARRDPGLVSQCLGDRRAAAAQQLVTVDGEHRLRGLEHRATQRCGGDPYLLQECPCVGRGRGSRGLSCSQRRCGDRQRGNQREEGSGGGRGAHRVGSSRGGLGMQVQ